MFWVVGVVLFRMSGDKWLHCPPPPPTPSVAHSSKSIAHVRTRNLYLGLAQDYKAVHGCAVRSAKTVRNVPALQRTQRTNVVHCSTWSHARSHARHACRWAYCMQNSRWSTLCVVLRERKCFSFVIVLYHCSGPEPAVVLPFASLCTHVFMHTYFGIISESHRHATHVYYIHHVMGCVFYLQSLAIRGRIKTINAPSTHAGNSIQCRRTHRKHIHIHERKTEIHKNATMFAHARTHKQTQFISSIVFWQQRQRHPHIHI